MACVSGSNFTFTDRVFKIYIYTMFMASLVTVRVSLVILSLVKFCHALSSSLSDRQIAFKSVFAI